MAAAGAGAAGADDGLIGPGDCGFCYAPVPPSERFVLHSPGGIDHIFHRACITPWLATSMQTGAPFICPQCAQTDDEVRLSARGLAWAERLALILMIRQADWRRIPRLELAAVENIPDERWPIMDYSIAGVGGVVAVSIVGWLVKITYDTYERLGELREGYNSACLEVGFDPDRRPMLQVARTLNDGRIVHYNREMPQAEYDVNLFAAISVCFFFYTLLYGIATVHILRNRRLGGGGSEGQKRICINDVCYPIPDGMEPILSSLIISLKGLLGKLNTSRTAKGGKHTRKQTRPHVLLSYKPSKRYSLKPKGFKASHKAVRPSKK